MSRLKYMSWYVSEFCANAWSDLSLDIWRKSGNKSPHEEICVCGTSSKAQQYCWSHYDSSHPSVRIDILYVLGLFCIERAREKFNEKIIHQRCHVIDPSGRAKRIHILFAFIGDAGSWEELFIASNDYWKACFVTRLGEWFSCLSFRRTADISSKQRRWMQVSNVFQYCRKPTWNCTNSTTHKLLELEYWLSSIPI